MIKEKNLYTALEKGNKINKIKATNIEEAINKAYENDDYTFYHNSELIDVQNRFRIFNYNNINYFIKSSKKEKAKAEVENTIQAAKLLNGKTINKYQIEVIESKLYIIEDKYYTVTEYKGNTLQEYLYNNSNPKFTFNDFETMLKTLMKLGIEHRGFCPRNMVVSDKDKKIYLFDFEDAHFLKEKKYYNIVEKTNLLVNWSYYYDINQIRKVINTKSGEEPKLNSYEKSFKELLGYSKSDKSLREIILDIVLLAERKVNTEKYKYFCILPMDMAAIISDLFNSDIDALMDMVFYTIRLKDETKYQRVLKLFNKTIINAYKNNKNLRKSITKVLLIAINTASDNNENFDDNLDLIFKTVYRDYKERKEVKERIKAILLR